MRSGGWGLVGLVLFVGGCGGPAVDGSPPAGPPGTPPPNAPPAPPVVTSHESGLTLSTPPDLRVRSGAQIGLTMALKNTSAQTVALGSKSAAQGPRVGWRLVDGSGRELGAQAPAELRNAWLSLGPNTTYRFYQAIWPACEHPLPAGRYRLDVRYESPTAADVPPVSFAVSIDLEVTTPAVPAREVFVTIPKTVSCCSREPNVGVLVTLENRGCQVIDLPSLTQVGSIDVTENGRAVSCRRPLATSGTSRPLRPGATLQERVDISGRCNVPMPNRVGNPRTYDVRLRYKDPKGGLTIDHSLSMSVSLLPHS